MSKLRELWLRIVCACRRLLRRKAKPKLLTNQEFGAKLSASSFSQAMVEAWLKAAEMFDWNVDSNPYVDTEARAIFAAAGMDYDTIQAAISETQLARAEKILEARAAEQAAIESKAAIPIVAEQLAAKPPEVATQIAAESTLPEPFAKIAFDSFAAGYRAQLRIERDELHSLLLVSDADVLIHTNDWLSPSDVIVLNAGAPLAWGRDCGRDMPISEDVEWVSLTSASRAGTISVWKT